MPDIKQVDGYLIGGSQDHNPIQIEIGSALDCPFCHADIDIQPITYLRINESSVHIFLKCKKCRNSFVGYYIKKPTNIYHLDRLSRGNFRFKKFGKKIEGLSPDFVKIYNQSEHAEQEELDEISGIGYRKALEFLVKDFLIHKQPDKENDIKKKFLGKCIEDYLENERIKELAKRATWLGNDETHYERVWQDKDVEDLKKMINILVNYVETELLTDSYLEDMTGNKDK